MERCKDESFLWLRSRESNANWLVRTGAVAISVFPEADYSQKFFGK